MDGRILNIVDEQGTIIGEDTRENIHNKGLLHKEVHVWFYTPSGEIIFQHRAKDKDTFPDLLDATVGGHVEIGDDFEDTALKEIEEETGVVADKTDLQTIDTIHHTLFDPVTKKTNRVIRRIFAFKFFGKLGELKIEVGKGQGFETWPLEKLEHASPADEKRFIPGSLDAEHISLYRRIVNL